VLSFILHNSYLYPLFLFLVLLVWRRDRVPKEHDATSIQRLAHLRERSHHVWHLTMHRGSLLYLTFACIMYVFTLPFQSYACTSIYNQTVLALAVRFAPTPSQE